MSRQQTPLDRRPDANIRSEPDAVRFENGEERPLGERGARTRARIMTAAYEVFAEHGYRNATVALIAEAAGVSAGAYYQYFRDRADVLAALVGEEAEELARGTRTPWDPARGILGLRRVVAGFVERYATTAPFQAVWEEVSHSDPEMAALRRRLTGVFVDAVEAGLRAAAEQGLARDDLDPRATASALTAMVDRYCYTAYVAGAAAGDGDGDGEAAPPVDDTVDLLTTLWADAIGLEPARPGAGGGVRDSADG